MIIFVNFSGITSFIRNIAALIMLLSISVLPFYVGQQLFKFDKSVIGILYIASALLPIYFLFKKSLKKTLLSFFFVYIPVLLFSMYTAQIAKENAARFGTYKTAAESPIYRDMQKIYPEGMPDMLADGVSPAGIVEDYDDWRADNGDWLGFTATCMAGKKDNTCGGHNALANIKHTYHIDIQAVMQAHLAAEKKTSCNSDPLCAKINKKLGGILSADAPQESFSFDRYEEYAFAFLSPRLPLLRKIWPAEIDKIYQSMKIETIRNSPMSMSKFPFEKWHNHGSGYLEPEGDGIAFLSKDRKQYVVIRPRAAFKEYDQTVTQTGEKWFDLLAKCAAPERTFIGLTHSECTGFDLARLKENLGMDMQAYLSAYLQKQGGVSCDKDETCRALTDQLAIDRSKL